MKLFTKSDLATRWGMSRQAVFNRSLRHEDFPKEFTRVDNGNMPLFKEVDILKYEKKYDLKQAK